MLRHLFLLSVSGSDFKTSDWALAALDEPTLRRIKVRREIFFDAKRRDSETYEVYYWDGIAVFFLDNGVTLDDGEELTEAQKRAEEALNALLEGDESHVRLLGLTDALDGHREAAVECVQMIVSEYGVRWMCYPKHVDDEMRTAEIPWTTLDALAEAQ